MQSRSHSAVTIAVLLLAVLVTAVSAGHASPARLFEGTSVERQMVVTIDDLPAVCTCQTLADWQELTFKLLETLATHEVPAIGFVNEGKLHLEGSENADPARVALLENWLDAGLELGNHSRTHPSLNRTPLDRYQQNVLGGERIIRPLLEARGTTLRFYRHPYLHTGRDLETKRGFERFLDRRGYQVAPVTVDNSDWIFARAYDLALDQGDSELAERIGEAYAPYMESKIAYYEDLAQQLFERDIPQILLIHANRINADHLGPLLDRIKDRGYAFVELETALEDAAFEHDDTYIGPAGLSWIERWWITEERSREPFKKEPPVPPWVLEASGLENE